MLEPQTVLNGRYQLEKLVGEGGFAQVFLATDLQLGRKVAVKILSSKMAEDPEFLARFKQEARSIATLDHPNILSVYDYGEYEGDPYLVMPYVEGGTLMDRLRKGPIPVEETGKLLEQMAAALDYAHDRNIVHRDVKPQNMLIRSDGRLMLTDFGIAKLVSTDSNSMTRPMGTISYMAPEQFDGHVSRQTDTYSLGVVLYQMLTGQLPFAGTTSQVLSGHYTKPVPSLVGQPALQLLNPAIVKRLDGVIEKAMAKNPHDRYSTTLDFANGYKSALVAPPGNLETQVATPARGIEEAARAATVFATPSSFVNPNNYPPQQTQPQFYNQNQFQTPPQQTQPNYGPPPSYPPQPGPNYSQPTPPPAKKSPLIPIMAGVAALLVVAIAAVLILSRPKDPTPVASVTATAVPATAAPTTAPATQSNINLGTTGTSTTAPVLNTTAPATATRTATAAATATTKPNPSATTPPKPTTVAPTVASGDTIKVPDGYTAYKNTVANKLNLEIAYPSDWKATPTDDALKVTFSPSSDNATTYTILREASSTTTSTVDEYNAEFINGLKKDGWTARTEDARFFGFAGEKWIQSSYEKNGKRAWGLFALHKGIPYAVVLTGNDSNFDTILGEQFTKMFDHMHFFGTPVDIFTSEIKSYMDPKGTYVINYPIDTYDLNTSNPLPTVVTKDKLTQFYPYDQTTSTSTLDQLLDTYKDKLAGSGFYENLKETTRYKLLNLDNVAQEKSLRFTYTYKGNNYLSELLIHKNTQNNKIFVAISTGTNDKKLDTIYYDVWRYMEYLK